MAPAFVIGADENGLGALLGPMIVTAVMARVDERGARVLSRKLPKWLAPDLDDSKRLVSHGNVALGEAWARALVGPDAEDPDAVVRRLTLETADELRAPCPSAEVSDQCWSVAGERFEAEPAVVKTVTRHLARLEERGVTVIGARCSVLCARRLNSALEQGHNRFTSDLHAMERLVLSFRAAAGRDVHAVCGKVGGIGDYAKFFGPLGGWLHVELAQGRKKSSYRFPGVGELHFVMDADAHHPLVMLASLVGKWVRELLMSRVARWHAPGSEEPLPSGYHDPVTKRFIRATELARKRRRVPSLCFERLSEADLG